MKRPRSDMKPHQTQSAELIKQRRYLALWLAMRQGKTIATLTAVQDLYDDFEVKKVLVVAPKKVSLNSWPEDLQAWDHISLSWTEIKGSPKQRLAAVQQNTTVHIIGRDNVAWLVSTIGKEDWPYDMVVLDESRSFKNHVLKTPNENYTRFGAIALVRPKIRRLVELTGTPAPRNYQDLWAQIYLLDGGRRLGKNITAFRREYMDPGREHYQWTFKEGAEECIRQALVDIAFAIEGTPLPEPVIEDIPIDLPPDAWALYKEMNEDKIITGLQGYDIVAMTPGIKAEKLHQIAAGFVYHHIVDLENQTKNRVEIPIHEEKLNTLDELLEFSDNPVIIVYIFQWERDQILARYKDAVLLDDNPETVKRWQRGQIGKLVMHPASGGHGLNLWEGGHEIIWMSLTHDAELYAQVNQRLSSQVKTKPTTVYRLLARRTVDYGIVASNGIKFANERELINFILAYSR